MACQELLQAHGNVFITMHRQEWVTSLVRGRGNDNVETDGAYAVQNRKSKNGPLQGLEMDRRRIPLQDFSNSFL